MLLVTEAGYVALSGWQVAGLFVGVPAVVFVLITIVVLRAAPRRTLGAFPVLRVPSSGSPSGTGGVTGAGPEDPVRAVSVSPAPEPERPQPAAAVAEPAVPAATVQDDEAGPEADRVQ